MSIVLLFVGRIYPSSVSDVKFLLYESLSPVLSFASGPVSTFHTAMDNISLHLNVVKENKLLIEENLILKRWKETAATLQHENKKLRSLLHFPQVKNKILLFVHFQNYHSFFENDYLIQNILGYP